MVPSAVFISVTGLPPFERVIACEPDAYVPPTIPTLAERLVSAVSLKIGSFSGNLPPNRTVVVCPITHSYAHSAAAGSVGAVRVVAAVGRGTAAQIRSPGSPLRP